MRLFPTLLGEDFRQVPAACQAMHGLLVDCEAAGVADIERGGHPLARFAAWMAGMPPAGRAVPLRVRFLLHGKGETWVRDFNGSRFASRLSAADDELTEALFPLRLRFRLTADAQGVRWQVTGARLLGMLPLPARLLSGIQAFEYEADHRYHFHAEVGLPLIGLIVRYRGWLGAPEPHAPDSRTGPPVS